MDRNKIRQILGYMIGAMPTSLLRRFLYRTLFGYRIRGSSIGWGTVLVVDEADLDGCSIGRNNRFIGPMRITIEKGARICDGNRFECGWWTIEERFEAANYARSLQIGENTLITSNHYFDAVGSFELGNDSWVAGTGSQFWTHGRGVEDRDIRIGERCYIGSAVRFAPGSGVNDDCDVGLGSVLTRKFAEKNVTIAGHPARIVKEDSGPVT